LALLLRPDDMDNVCVWLLWAELQEEWLMGENGNIRARLGARDGTEIIVRRLQQGDGPALQEFNEGLSETSRSLFLPHAYSDDRVARVIERSEQNLDLIYIGLVGERVICYFFLWNFNDRSPILGIGITDDYQDQGLGRKLMTILIEDARAADMDGIELTTSLLNARAFALYQKMGFEYMGDVKNITGDGSEVTERAMFLALKPGAKPAVQEFRPPE